MNNSRNCAHLVLLFALVLATPLVVDAQCRAEGRIGNNWVSDATREYPVTVHLEESLDDLTVSIKGTICDEKLRPLEGVWGQLVRFELPEGRTLESITVNDFRTGSIEQSSQKEFISAPNGNFEVPDLRPGDYVFLVEWPEDANTNRVYFDFRISHGYSVRAQYVRP